MKIPKLKIGWPLAAVSVTSLISSVAFAGAPDAMVIKSAAQSLALGACSAPVKVQAVDVAGANAKVSANTQIFFTGSSGALRFFCGLLL